MVCAIADAKNLVVKVTHSVPHLFFIEIITCTMLSSMNAIKNILSHDVIQVIHDYDQSMSKVDLHYRNSRNKELFIMITIKEV